MARSNRVEPTDLMAGIRATELAEQLLEVGRRTHAQMSRETVDLDHGTELYDGRGLPR